MNPSKKIAKPNVRLVDDSDRSSSLRNRGEITTQSRLLLTQTVRLKKEGIKVRYAELGDPSKPSVLLLHGVPENLQAWYAVAPLLAESCLSFQQIQSELKDRFTAEAAVQISDFENAC